MPSLSLLWHSIQESPLLSRSDMSASAAEVLAAIRPAGRFNLPIFRLVARDDGSDNGSDTMLNALLSIFGIAFFALIVVFVLLIIRRTRRLRQKQRQQPILPSYNEANHGHSNHRGLTIETTQNGRSSVLFIGTDGQPMLQNPRSPPHSPDNVPEIHITFPDEHDDQGRRKSGRVLIVRVGDNAAVGLEPMYDEQLPAYEKEATGQLYSIDMDRIGGLKEEQRSVFEE